MRLRHPIAIAAFGALALTFVPGMSSVAYAEGNAAAASSAAAPVAKANLELMILQASNEEPGGIDARIDEGYAKGQGPSAQLGKPPFSAYKTYKLRERKLLGLEKGKSSDVLMPNGRKLQVTLTDVTSEKGEKRYKMSASISQPDGKAYLPLLEVTASEGKSFFVAGQSFEKGSIVLAMTVKP